MRFLLDEDVNPESAEVARGLGLDAISVHEIDRRGLPDDEQLLWAAREVRIFVTRNRDDFIRLTLERFRTGEAHAVGQIETSQARDAVVDLAEVDVRDVAANVPAGGGSRKMLLDERRCRLVLEPREQREGVKADAHARSLPDAPAGAPRAAPRPTGHRLRTAEAELLDDEVQGWLRERPRLRRAAD